jgi:uncharacterized membrane protein
MSDANVDPIQPPMGPAAPPRLDSVDLLRGLVMVIMALDHTRDYFGLRELQDPMNMATTTPALFFTRWITHFCAPVFVFLAGTGAFLSGTRGKSTGQLSWFLFSRGLWLALLDVTIIRYSWIFSFDNHGVGIGVIWAIGWSMVVLSLLVWLPTSAITVFGVAMIALHNAFDNYKAADVGDFGWLWAILHTQEPVVKMAADGAWQVGGSPFDFRKAYFVFSPGYPLIPWIGVLAAGYGFGALLMLEPRQRKKQLLGLGIALTALFAVLRLTNVYGDLYPWKKQERGDLFTFFSMLNCHKYPPSLDYLLMTLGPAITALAFFDRTPGALGRFFIIYGRVPLFYYLLHLPLIHAGVRLAAQIRGDPNAWTADAFAVPDQYRFTLTEVYLIWIGVVLFLYPLCYWFAGVKRRHRDVVWLSYL